MSQGAPNPKAFTPKRIRRQIKLDRVQASDFNNLPMVFACEHCSFFAPDTGECMMGMPTHPHREQRQRQLFNLTGHMAFCRFQEID
jgi:hypothetical protein